MGKALKPDPDNLKVSIYWVTEREKIRIAKESGRPPPWTKDALIANTRWCNVRRMDDKVSRRLMENFYQNRKSLSIKDLTLAATMARTFNKTETLELFYPNGYDKFRPNRIANVCKDLKSSGKKIFTGVYIINGAGANGRSKWELVLDNLSAMQDSLTDESVDTSSMENTHASLMKFRGLGSFIAGQVVADLRHIAKGKWADRHVWAPQGPGSSRGLNFVFNTVGQPMNSERFHTLFPIFMDHMKSNPRVRAIHEDRGLEAHDYQNVLCETSKMARLLSGGRSKNRYHAESAQGNLF